MRNKILIAILLILAFSCAKKAEKKEEKLSAESEYLKAFAFLKDKNMYDMGFPQKLINYLDMILSPMTKTSFKMD